MASWKMNEFTSSIPLTLSLNSLTAQVGDKIKDTGLVQIGKISIGKSIPLSIITGYPIQFFKATAFLDNVINAAKIDAKAIYEIRVIIKIITKTTGSAIDIGALKASFINRKVINREMEPNIVLPNILPNTMILKFVGTDTINSSVPPARSRSMSPAEEKHIEFQILDIPVPSTT